MTPLTPAAVTALAQQAAESPAHLDPVLVQQVCQEWEEQRAEVRRLQQQAEQALVTRIEAIEQGNSLAQRLIEQRDAALAERDALKADLKLTQGVLNAAQHRLIVWGCRDGHDEDDCPLCSAEHALLNTREYLAEARRVLREVEWHPCHGDYDGATRYACPMCDCEDREHASDCALAAVLAQEEK